MMCWTFQPPEERTDFAAFICTQPRTCKRCETCPDHCDCPDEITREFYCDGVGDA